MNFVYVFSCIGPYCIGLCLSVLLFYCTCTTFVVNKRKHKSNIKKQMALTRTRFRLILKTTSSADTAF